MLSKNTLLFLLPIWVLSVVSLEGFAQTTNRISGPIIQDFGHTYKVDQADVPIDTDMVYRVVFDVYSSPADSSRLNPSLNTLARFLNMHAAAGIPVKQLHVAAVVHNQASIDVMNNQFYRERFGIDNPNAPLIEALDKAGVQIFMCGQSIQARHLDRNSLIESVQVGLSAMTVILSLQQEGYQLIRF
ncbi:MAG: DsrE family protein [Bacteroidota bacterium]